VPVYKRPKSVIKSRPKVINEPMSVKQVERAVTPDITKRVNYKQNTLENRQRYANMAYYIDQEEKKRVMSEDLE